MQRKRCKVFYVVRPDFFHHNHIHQRKIVALKAAGYEAEMIAFVPPSVWNDNPGQYADSKQRHGVRVIRVNDTGRLRRYKIAGFFAAQCLRYTRILVHFLIADPEPVFALRNWRFFGKRIRTLVEFEGDEPAEMLYLHTVNDSGGPQEEPPSDFRADYAYLINRQMRLVSQCDGLVLMSNAQRDLLYARYSDRPPAVAVPPLFDPKTLSFDADKRVTIRDELGWANKTVLLHLGGAINAWHRFAETCRFVAKLMKGNEDIRFLALVRETDVEYARQQIRDAGIEENSLLKHVPGGQVAGYLSAADIGLILRHDHTMTRVVSSAKLGEYLATGLPVASTGAHAIFSDALTEKNAVVCVPPNLAVTPQLLGHFKSISQKGQDPEWRVEFSAWIRHEFIERNNPLNEYVALVDQLLA